MEKKKFNVLTWDFNKDNIEHYDVLPHFRECYKKRVDDYKSTVKKAWWKKPEALFGAQDVRRIQTIR